MAVAIENSDTWLDLEWYRIRRRMVDRIQERASDLGPQPLKVSTSTYTDPLRWEAERRHIFAETPLLAGFSQELPEPGSVLLFDTGGSSIFIVRTQEGSLNAFLNMCPHRGARLVDDTRSRLSFVCPFHAWRFNANGNLVARPLKEAFGENCGNTDLIRVPVAEKYGLVFIRAQPGGEAIDVDAFLGPMASLLKCFNLTGASLVKADQLVVEANWKLVVDVSCEGYHVPATHTVSLHPQLVPFLTVHDSFGSHHRFCSPSRHLEQCVGKPESEWPKSNYSGVHYLYPNTVLTYTDAINGRIPMISVNRSFPGRQVGETLVIYTTYKPATADPAHDADFLQLHDMVFRINQTEDIPTVSKIWKNYERLSKPADVIFGRNEFILQRYHTDVARAIGMPLQS